MYGVCVRFDSCTTNLCIPEAGIVSNMLVHDIVLLNLGNPSYLAYFDLILTSVDKGFPITPKAVII